MVLPIGFFMPLPLAMMIPFMGIQSAVMAKQFGENFQYGKRRISAMSNEEFNKLTPKLLNENANRELKSMIPSMEASIIEMRHFQTFLIQEFVRMIHEVGLGVIGQIFGFPKLGETITEGPVTVETETDTGPAAGTPSPIISYDQDSSGTVTTSQEPIIPLNRINAEPVSKAVGRVEYRTVSNNLTLWYISAKNWSRGTFSQQTQFPTKQHAVNAAAIRWPSPKYFPSYREKFVYYFRIQK